MPSTSDPQHSIHDPSRDDAALYEAARHDVAPSGSAPAVAEPRRRRGCLWTVALIALALIVLGFWYGPSVRAQADLGASFAARIGCSCHYVQGRPLDSCPADFPPGVEAASLSVDEASKTVSASVVGIASASATYKPGFGCLLDTP